MFPSHKLDQRRSPEPFLVVANGRSPFRLTDLLELSRLLQAISPEKEESEGKKV